MAEKNEIDRIETIVEEDEAEEKLEKLEGSAKRIYFNPEVGEIISRGDLGFATLPVECWRRHYFATLDRAIEDLKDNFITKGLRKHRCFKELETMLEEIKRLDAKFLEIIKVADISP